jgi:hypothetical protein
MKTISLAMRDVLVAIAVHERGGMIGAMPNLYPFRTMVALDRRGLITPNVDGSRRLTAAGWSAIGVERGQ